MSGGWSVFWNELLDGAPRGRHRSVAATASRLGEMMTAHSSTARWFRSTFADGRTPLLGPDVDQELEASAASWSPRLRSDRP